jgi:hypothetical protein
MFLCVVSDDDPEERGGFILKKGNDFKFIPVMNIHTGTSISHGLYRPEPNEFGEKVLGPILYDGWKLYASFHTHPNGYSPIPSGIDVQQLFLGHQINYIYATKTDELVEYSKMSEFNSFDVDSEVVDSGETEQLFISVLPIEGEPDGKHFVLWQAHYVRLRTSGSQGQEVLADMSAGSCSTTV